MRTLLASEYLQPPCSTKHTNPRNPNNCTIVSRTIVPQQPSLPPARILSHASTRMYLFRTLANFTLPIALSDTREFRIAHYAFGHSRISHCALRLAPCWADGAPVCPSRKIVSPHILSLTKRCPWTIVPMPIAPLGPSQNSSITCAVLSFGNEYVRKYRK